MGVEIDPYLVDRSKDVLAPFGTGRHRIVEGSILDIPFKDGSFDFVIARLVLEHLPDPVAAALEMRRVLKTGGKVVVVDNDFDMHLKSYPRFRNCAICMKHIAPAGRRRAASIGDAR